MQLFLEIIARDRSYPPFPLPEGRVLVGRHPDCDILLEDPHASRKQLAIDRRGDDCVLEDLGSKNPVRLNGKVCTSGPLRPGDVIEVGDTSLQLRLGAIDSQGDHGGAIALVAENHCQGVRRLEVTAETIAEVVPVAARGSSLASQLEAFHRLSEGLASSDTPDEFFERLLSCLFAATPSERGFVALGSPGSDSFQAVKVRSLRPGEGGTIEMSQTVLDEIQLERKALLVEDAPGELAHEGAQSIIRIGIRSFLCAPLIADDEVLGLIYLDQSSRAEPFTEEHLSFLRSMAAVCGLAIDNLRVREQLRAENRSLRGILERKNQLVGQSPVMIEVLRKVQKVATRDAPVLIHGETGTGKELIAQAIHDQSARRDGPFVAFNCSLSNPRATRSAHRRCSASPGRPSTRSSSSTTSPERPAGNRADEC